MRISCWVRGLATPRVRDAGISGLLLIWGLPDVPWWWEDPGHAGTAPEVASALALTLAMSVPFLWRRRFPVPVLVLACTVLAVRAALHRDVHSAFAAVLAGGYGLGAYLPSGRRYARLAGWFAGAAAVAVVVGSIPRTNAVPFALLAAALLTGDAASARRGELAATARATEDAERARIARDLHDLVAHQLTTIAMRAGAARLALRTTPGQPPIGHMGTPAELMSETETLARQALIELNHLLGSLRREPSDNPARSPAPTLADLPALAAAARTAGLPARLVTQGEPRPLEPGLELAAYRIIAEALTNVAKHAPEARCRALVAYGPAELRIEVANDPSPATAAAPGLARAGLARGGGRGLAGMRERAELYEGTLAAEPTAGGGFLVRASFPLPDDLAQPGNAQPGNGLQGCAQPGHGLMSQPR